MAWRRPFRGSLGVRFGARRAKEHPTLRTFDGLLLFAVRSHNPGIGTVRSAKIVWKGGRSPHVRALGTYASTLRVRSRALVLFGPKHLIEASKELGQYIRRIQEYKEELKDDLTSPPAKQEPQEKLPSTTGSTTEKKG